MYQLLGPSMLTLSLFKVSYSSGWFLFQLYGESVNVSYIADFCRWSFCVKICLSDFCAVLTVQGLNLCRSFCSFLDLLRQPFLGLSSLHLILGGSCHKTLYHLLIYNYLSYLVLDDDGCLNAFLPVDLFI